MAGVKMDCLSKFSEIKESIVKCLLEKRSEEDWKKWVDEWIIDIQDLYGVAEHIITKSPSAFPDSLYYILAGFLNDTDFLKSALQEKHLNPVIYFELLEELSDTGFACLRDDAKKEVAGILFEFKEFIDQSYRCRGISYEEVNKKFLSLIKSLDPEYDVTDILRSIAAMMIRDTEVKNEKDLFEVTGGVCAWNFINSYNCLEFLYVDGVFNEKKFDEINSFFYKNFFREKVLNSECFKKLPEFFQKTVIFLQIGGFKNGELLSELGIDNDDLKEYLKKEIDNFLLELKKIAGNAGKPSDYYAGESLSQQYWLSDPESYLVTQIFNRSISFLKKYSGSWKALKPMLAIFRSLKKQAYHMCLQRREIYLYPWAFVPVSITQLLGSMEESETREVCAEWFEYLGKQLRSADDFEVKKRTENPELVQEKFRNGYDIKVIEPHPVWREAYCEAAGDLRVNLGFEKCRIFKHLQKYDIDENVRKAAGKTLERVEKIKEKFDSTSRKRALLNAWWWYRVAHLKSLNIDFDWVSAQDRKRKEVSFYFPKDFF